MVGYISEAVANALREWPELKAANIFPVRATDDGFAIVDTPTLPAIAVYIRGKEGKDAPALGGLIRLYFDLELHYICGIPNKFFTQDGGAQAKELDRSEEVIRCMERTQLLLPVAQEHGFQYQFNSLVTEPNTVTKAGVAYTVEVHKVTYDCHVLLKYYDTDKDYVKLEDIIYSHKELKT